ncbi:MAG: 3-dehydroquinate synthase [Thermodesulfobacteriota bacterium]
MTEQFQEKIVVELGDRSYPIYLNHGGLKMIGELLDRKGSYKRTALITNPTIKGLYGDMVGSGLVQAGFEVNIIEIPDGERYKTLRQVSKIYDFLVDLKMDRYSPIIALGGGVVGDITGFAAATYLRGVPYIQIPTTLLAQVDSSVGGKTGVNHPAGKNLIGAFYQPGLVFIDVCCLKTLKGRDLKAGLAEVVKYGIIRDEGLFSFLEENIDRILNLESKSLIRIVNDSCRIKADIVEKDEHENGLRAILNLGHTFGHAIERLAKFKKFRHGEAVAIGMVMSARFSHRLGLCGPNIPKRIEALLLRIGLPVHPPAVSMDEFLEAIKIDKKVKGGKARVVLIERLGKVLIKEMEWKDFSLDLLRVLN